MKTKWSRLSASLAEKLFYVAAYLLWLVNMLVCVAAVIQLRSTVNVFWVVLGGDRYTLSLVNQVCLLVSGFVAFVYVMFLESYYRASLLPSIAITSTSIHSQPLARWRRWWSEPGLGTLLRRFMITTAIPLLMCLLSLVMLEPAFYTFLR